MKEAVGLHTCGNVVIVMAHVTHCMWVSGNESVQDESDALYLKVWLTSDKSLLLRYRFGNPANYDDETKLKATQSVKDFLQALSLYWETRS